MPGTKWSPEHHRRRVRGDLARWVEDHVDALVRSLTSENDGVVVITDEGDMVNNGDGGIADGGDDSDEDDDDASDASMDDAPGDISG